MKTMYVCEDSAGGIFSAIYDAWKAGRPEGSCGIAIRENIEPQLFCEYEEVEESSGKAAAVERMILKHMGRAVYQDLYYAALSRESDRGSAILGTMLAARRLPDSSRIMEHLSHPDVERVFELQRNVGQEAHLLTGFVRFREIEGGILFAEIAPKNQVLPCLGDHFAGRFPLENWMIYDKNRQMFVLHEAGKQWVLGREESLDLQRTKRLSAGELEIQRLWKGFCRTIAIEERKNPSCQRQRLPLWYRPGMTEFREEDFASESRTKLQNAAS